MRILKFSVLAVFMVTLLLFSYFFISENINVDKTYPTITIEGDMLEVDTDAEESDFLKGVTAFDEKDKDLTGDVIVESVSKFREKGICKVTYAVCDSDNHVAKATRKIKYKNYVSPRFKVKESTCFSIYENTNVEGIIEAIDCIDGNITRDMIITSEDYTPAVSGVFTLDVSVTNSKGDTSKVQLPLIVEDRSISAPEIKLSNYLIYLDKGEKVNLKDYIESATSRDGNDLKSEVSVESQIDFNKSGTYNVHYYVKDKDGERGHTVLSVVVGS